MDKLTKIIATIGPASDSPEMITALIRSGVNVFRFNFKHNTIEWHSERIERVNKIAKKLGIYIGTLIDLQGPELRINMPTEAIDLSAGEEILFGEEVFQTKEKGLSITHPDIINHLRVGQTIVADDGAFTFKIIKKGKKIYLQSLQKGVLKTRKTLNIPGADFPFPVLIDRDFEGLKLAARLDIDFVALSFVRSVSDVKYVKKEMKKHGVNGKIISKIETQRALNDLDSIIEESDGIMVARGDLGVEIPIEEVPYFQKLIINKCMISGKFVITATQMLQTMIDNPYPTRAEVSDIANAVYDHTDCIMLSGETANGLYPLKSVEMMARTAKYHESRSVDDLHISIPYSDGDQTSIICDTAYGLYRKYIKTGQTVSGFVVFSQSGKTAQILSRYRPKAPIYSFSPNEDVCEGLCMNFGLKGYIFPYKEADEVKIKDVRRAVELIRKKEHIKKNGTIIVIHGDAWGRGRGASTIRIV